MARCSRTSRTCTCSSDWRSSPGGKGRKASAMINEAPLARFAPLAGGLVKPIYADYSFANIANTVELLLTGERRGPVLPADCFGGETHPAPQKVVVIFVDSFGWEFWQQYHRRFRATRRVRSE